MPPYPPCRREKGGLGSDPRRSQGARAGLGHAPLRHLEHESLRVEASNSLHHMSRSSRDPALITSPDETNPGIPGSSPPRPLGRLSRSQAGTTRARPGPPLSDKAPPARTLTWPHGIRDAPSLQPQKHTPLRGRAPPCWKHPGGPERRTRRAGGSSAAPRASCVKFPCKLHFRPRVNTS